MTISRLHLALILRANGRFTDLDARDPFLFPNLARLSLTLVARPELDLEVRLFGMLDILALPGLCWLKTLIVDYICDKLGPQADGSLKNWEVRGGEWEDYQLDNIDKKRRGVTQEWDIWDYYFTDYYGAADKALVGHGHVLVVYTLPCHACRMLPSVRSLQANRGVDLCRNRTPAQVSILYAPELPGKNDCRCFVRYGVGANSISSTNTANAGTSNDQVEYVTGMPTGIQRCTWHEQHSFLVRTYADLFTIEVRDSKGSTVGMWSDTLHLLMLKLFNHAPLGTKHYKRCDLAPLETKQSKAEDLLEGIGCVHVMLQLLCHPVLASAAGREAGGGSKEEGGGVREGRGPAGQEEESNEERKKERKEDGLVRS